MQNIASERLQEMLNYWKDACMLFEAAGKSTRRPEALPPYIRNWRQLESRIFDQRNEQLDLNEWDFTGELQGSPFMTRYGLLPHEFFAWNRKSRRATHLPRELQRPFSVAPFPGTRFGDIKLPFDSFIITLEEPVKVQETEYGPWTEFDAIWVTRFPWKGEIRCRLMRKPAPMMERVRPNAVRRIEIAYRRGARNAAEEFRRTWIRWHKETIDPPGHFIFPLYPAGVSTKALVADYVTPEYFAQDLYGVGTRSQEEIEWRADWTCRIAKIVIGWCLYLKHLPSESYAWQEWQQPERGTRGTLTGAITDPSHICSILRISTMDIGKYREKNPDKSGSNFFQWPHWRSGHWKRERGAGPKAPKTVWIEPYEVRKDLMPLFSIHGGQFTKVEADL
jgi:hypothetical protein